MKFCKFTNVQSAITALLKYGSFGILLSSSILFLHGDNRAPGFDQAFTNVNGTKVFLSYDENIYSDTASPSDFTLKVDQESVDISSVNAVGNAIVLTLDTAITEGQDVTVEYADPTEGDDESAIQDYIGNDSASLTEISVQNHVFDGSTHSFLQWGGAFVPEDLDLDGDGLEIIQVIQVNNFNTFAALRDDGSVVTWGLVQYGGDSSSVSDELSSGVTKILSTYGSYAALKEDGSVVTWGHSSYGGNSSAVADDLSSGVKDIYATDRAFAALKDDGSVVTWGQSSSGGELGRLYAYTSKYSRTLTEDVSDQLTSGVVSLSSTIGAFAALKEDGSVVTWGDETQGGITQIYSYDGTVANEESPAVYEEPSGDLDSGVTHIFSSRLSFAALKDDGSVVVWGSKTQGADTASASDDISSGVQTIYSNDQAYAALKQDGSLITWGHPSYGGNSDSVAAKLSGGINSISNTTSAFAALKDDGSVVTWGDSNNGGNSGSVSSQLQSGVTEITANNYSFAALKDDGSVVSWGYYLYGGNSTLYAEELSNGITKVAAKLNGFAALKEDGTLVSWGYHSQFADMDGPSNSGAISNIVAGQTAFAAFRGDGAVITWGDVNSGGSSSAVADDLRSGITQIYSNSSAFVAVREDGDAFTWGNSSNGGDSSSVINDLNADFRITGSIRTEVNEGNIGDTVSSSSESLEISRNSKNVEIFGTSTAFAALKEDGSVVTWGNSSVGGDSSDVNNLLTSGVSTITANANAFAALKDDGSVVTWGYPNYGGVQKIWQFPTNTSTNQNFIETEDVSSELSSNVVKVFSNDYSFTALTTEGKAISWGIEHMGGIHAIASNFNYSADPPYELSEGDEISAKLQDGVIDIAATMYAYAALKDDGSVVTWGNTSYGGNSSSVTDSLQSGVQKVYANSYAFAALKTDGSVVTWGYPSWGGDSSSVSDDINSGVVDIFFTNYAFAALKSDGSLLTWGIVPNAEDVADDLASGVSKAVGNYGAFAALKDDGSVVTWGIDTSGGDSSLVDDQLTSDVLDVAATYDAFAAYKTDGSIVTWGNPFNGGNPNHFDGLRTNQQFGTIHGTGTSIIARIVSKDIDAEPDNKVPADANLIENTGFEFSGFFQISTDDPNDDVTSVLLSVDQQGSLNVDLQDGATISSGSNDSSSLTVSGTHSAINSTLSTLTYSNLDGYTGTENLTVTSNDSTALSDTDVIPIAVALTPVPPSLVAFESTNGTSNYGTFTLEVSEDGQTGQWSYTLNPSTVQFLDVDEAATDSVTVTATDGMTKSVIIDIIGDNDPLTITSDAEYSGIEDADQITGTVVALDPEGREGIVIAYALDDSSTSGTVSINEETGAWSYQPNSNFFGTDTFIASATDDLDVTTQQTITITVSAVNDAPVLDSIGSISTQEDTTKTHTLGATDIEDLDSTLTYSAVSSKTEVSASVNGTQLILIPQLNWYGTANITVKVTDSDGGEDEEIFLFTVNSVNDEPNISNPGTQEFTEKDIHPVVLTISDVETANPAIQVSTSDNGLEATVDGSTLNLTSDGWYGDATVTVTITDDDQATDEVTFNVTVNPFNVEPPVHTVPGEQQIDTSKPYVFSIATENAIQVDDLDSEQITMTLEVQYGILKLQQTTGLEFKGGTADQTSKMTIFGNLGDINAALDGMAYCSTTGYVGGDTIVLHSVDNGELVDDDTVPLTVEVVAVPGQPNLQVSTLIQPGKTMTNINVTQFDTEKIQKAEIMGEGDNLEIAIQAIGKQDGSSDHSTVDVEIFYDDGTSEIVTVPVVIYHAKLAVTQEVAGIAQLNRSTGLYEQIVEVENTTPYTMEAIRIHVEGLNENVTLQSTTGTGDDGTPYVQYDVPMTPGEKQNFLIEFRSRTRRWDAATSIILELLPEADSQEISGEVVSLSEELARVDEDGSDAASYYLSFLTEEGQQYYIQYTDNLGDPESWRTSPVSITGNDLRQVWVDDGPPKTITSPDQTTSRFYRIIVPVENEVQP